MKLDADDFELFGLTRRQAQDRAQIDVRWKALQGEVHPDRFAAHGDAAQRLAMQWAVRVNEAFQRLKDPLRRAAYLCELHGEAVEAEDNTAMPAEFLMQQMAWREALDDADRAAAVDALNKEVLARRRHLLAELETTLDVRKDWPAAAQQVRALMFVERFVHDLDRRLEALGQ
ncbi:MAG: Fe-S protein assembly co-chaperone HscB [Methylibium sp.]|uniref:Fe-S protein assembly co-chaperone HscB n=1 Tax=Methylibium sp. TaxID=2067992 RepID=UPI0017DF513B|nr:Fe-S protein assembly co-chaperone HscB [Methylibium sp.]MBA3588874.1 Fe-S protein assembly co-chaperone HscB [Methylibium sp.]MBA3625446.1 Fe-S protein assembly co-chaperone HscB [Methylibium sp.]